MSNLLLRTESEHSVAESDDHIMEGGITIQQRKDIARRQVRLGGHVPTKTGWYGKVFEID